MVSKQIPKMNSLKNCQNYERGRRNSTQLHAAVALRQRLRGDGPSVRDGGGLFPAGGGALCPHGGRIARPAASCWDIWLRWSQRVHSAACCPTLRPTCSSAAPSRPRPPNWLPVWTHGGKEDNVNGNVILSFAWHSSRLPGCFHTRSRNKGEGRIPTSPPPDPLHTTQKTEEFHIRARLLSFIITDNPRQQMEQTRNPLDSSAVFSHRACFWFAVWWPMLIYAHVKLHNGYSRVCAHEMCARVSVYFIKLVSWFGFWKKILWYVKPWSINDARQV